MKAVCLVPGPANHGQLPVVDPEVVARKAAAMSLGRAQARSAPISATRVRWAGRGLGRD
jgi:hypothetical protein